MSIQRWNVSVLSPMLLVILSACGLQKYNDNMADKKQAEANVVASMPPEKPDILMEFAKWTPVFEGDKAFESQGHGGIIVRSYLNEIATTHIKMAPQVYPLAQGSILAKAVVATESTPVSEASRVYFMKKEAPGFDPENGDWSYSLAKRVDGKLMMDSSISPKEVLCVSCHVKFKKFDNVKTVEFYRMKKVF